MRHDSFPKKPVAISQCLHARERQKRIKANLARCCRGPVLHDWPGELGHRILAGFVTAMKPGYGKLLVGEDVFPQILGCAGETTSLDLVMMEQYWVWGAYGGASVACVVGVGSGLSDCEDLEGAEGRELESLIE